MTDWNNRIIGHGEESPEQLAANPKNWRIHPQGQQDVLKGAIDDVGFIRSVTVNKRTGYVLDGHLRVSLAISSGQTSIPVEYVDLSEAEEAEALAVLDPIAGLAAADREQLGALMADIEHADAAVSEMLAEMQRSDVSNTDWLDAYSSDSGDDSSDVMNRDRGGYVELSFSLTPEQRDEVNRALSDAKKRWGLSTSFESLVAICHEYLSRRSAHGA